MSRLPDPRTRPAIGFVFLLILTLCAVPARADSGLLNGSLGRWLDTEVLPELGNTLGEHPRFKGETIKLVSLRVCCETGETPNAVMTLNINGEERQSEASGDGPVDASFKAIEKLTQTGVNLQLYSVNAITTGTDSQGEVTVRVEKGGQVVNGQGADTDIVIASAKSYINALNKVINNTARTHPQLGNV